LRVKFGNRCLPPPALAALDPDPAPWSGHEAERHLGVTSVKSSDGQTPAKIVGMANLTKSSLAGLYGRYQSNHSIDFFVEDDG